MLKAAVIGCGRMGAEPSMRLAGKVPQGWLPISHAESFVESSNFDLVALAETNRARLDWVGKHYRIDALFENYRDLLAEIAPDVIGVATRTPEKLEILRQACRSGVKGIYVEKPLANCLCDARAILDEAAQANVILSYGVNRRYHALYRRARDLIHAGEIGDLVEIVIEFGQSQLLWTHPHSVDLMLFLGGQRPLEVQAELMQESVVTASEVKIDSDPVVSFARFQFDGGMQGLITRGAGNNIRVHGTQGSLEIAADGASLHLRKAHGAPAGYFLQHETVFPLSSKSATVVAIEELARNVNGESIASISSDEIYQGMQMLWGCVYSHMHNNAKCRLTDLPGDLIVTGRFGSAFA
jgi:predicted dehydrogenase